MIMIWQCKIKENTQSILFLKLYPIILEANEVFS